MPLIENYDLQRIKGDLAKAKAKLAGYRAGDHRHAEEGVPPETADRAHAANTASLYTTIQRLESEYVTAMVGCGAWCYSEIIKRMES
jgi:hypothetical protein